MRKTLTAKVIASLAPDRNGKRYDVMDATVPNLGVRVLPTGTKTYIFVARFPGSRNPTRRMIGDADEMSLASAREIARSWLETLADNRDPQDLGRRALASSGKGIASEPTVVSTPSRSDGDDVADEPTFKEVAELFMKRHVRKQGLKKKQVPLRSADEVQRILDRYVLADFDGAPRWRDRLIAKISRSDVTALLDIVEDEHGSRQADGVLALLSKLFNWHATRTDDFSSPIIRGMKRVSPTANARKRILNDAEIRALWHCTGAVGTFGSFARVLLLTAQRRTKIQDMKWDEISPTGDWTIATEAREKGNPLVLKLPALATDTINQIPRRPENPFVFAGRRRGKPINGLSNAKKELDEAMAIHMGTKPTHWVLHDLRRTAKTLMRRAGVSREISERVLGHAIPGAEGVYDQYSYYDEKAAALRKLGLLVGKILAGKGGSKRIWVEGD